MLLTVGGLSLGVNQTLVTTDLHTLWSGVGQPYAQVRRLQAQGYLLTTVPTGTVAQRQADLTLLENALKTALSTPYPDIRFYQDSGALSADNLLNAGSISGVEVVQFDFPRAVGPEYCTERSYTFTAQAEYPLPGTANYALEYEETLVFGGGGAIYVHRPALNGPPQKQLIYPQTAYTCRQTGYVVGYLSRLAVNPPKFPGALMRSPDVVQKSPARRRKGAFYQGFLSQWDYYFESVGPLAAAPSLWVG